MLYLQNSLQAWKLILKYRNNNGGDCCVEEQNPKGKWNFGILRTYGWHSWETRFNRFSNLLCVFFSIGGNMAKQNGSGFLGAPVVLNFAVTT